MTSAAGGFVAEETILSLTVENRKALASLNELSRALEDTADTAARTADAAGKVNAANDSVGRAVESATKRLREYDREWQSLERRIPGSASALERFTRLQQQADKALAAGRLTAEQHATAITTLRQRYVEAGDAIATTAQRVTPAMAQLSTAHDTAAASAGRLRGVMGQLGFQVQDVAVQLAGGQNALLVFAQQGSQLAGAFGPAGAAIGAVIAVAGAAGMALGALGKEAVEVSRATDAAKASTSALDLTLQNAKTGADELAKKYRTLSAEMREVERVASIGASRKLLEEQDAIRKAVDAQVASLEKRRAAFEASQRAIANGEKVAPENIERFAIMKNTFDAIDRFRKGGSIADVVSNLQRLADLGGETAEPLEATATSLAEWAKQAATVEERQKRLDASMRLLNGTATAADKALLNMGDTATKSGEKARTFADILDDLAAKGRELERQKTDQAFNLINRTIEAGLTPAQEYERQVDAVREALERARASGWEPTREQVEAINRALQESNPAWQEAMKQAEALHRQAERIATDITDYPDTLSPDDEALFLEALS